MPEPTTKRRPARPPRPAVSPARAYLAAGVLCALVLVPTLLHARQTQRRALVELAAAWAQVGHAVETQSKASELAAQIRALGDEVRRHGGVKPAIALGAVTATLINRLPETATLDRLELRVLDEGGHRMLRGSAAGFAPDLLEMDAFATRLDQMPPFEDVRFEERPQHDRESDGAFGFAVTFRVDLDRRARLATAGDVRPAGTEGAAR